MKCPRCSRTMREVSRREPTWRDADKTTEVVYLCRCGRKAAEVTSAAAGACRDLDPSHNAPWGDSTHLRLQRREGSQKAPSMAALLNVLRDVYSEYKPPIVASDDYIFRPGDPGYGGTIMEYTSPRCAFCGSPTDVKCYLDLHALCERCGQGATGARALSMADWLDGKGRPTAAGKPKRVGAPPVLSLRCRYRDRIARWGMGSKPTEVRAGQVWEYSEGQVTVAEFSPGGTTAIFREQAPSGERYSIGAGTMLAHPAWRFISDAPAKPEPLPKPERVEVGQRWEWVGDEPTGQMTVVGTADGGRVFMAENPYGSYYARRMDEDDDWRYLGGNDDT